MHKQTITPKHERYKRIQNVCDNMLLRLEDYFNQNSIFDDIKELAKLELLLKLRSKLIELDKDMHENAYRHTALEQTDSRQDLIENIIDKITKATQKS